jgi:hypothetical protein
VRTLLLLLLLLLKPYFETLFKKHALSPLLLLLLLVIWVTLPMPHKLSDNTQPVRLMCHPPISVHQLLLHL